MFSVDKSFVDRKIHRTKIHPKANFQIHLIFVVCHTFQCIWILCSLSNMYLPKFVTMSNSFRSRMLILPATLLGQIVCKRKSKCYCFFSPAAELAAKKSRVKQSLIKRARSVAIFSLKLKERRAREAEKQAYDLAEQEKVSLHIVCLLFSLNFV